MDALQIARLVSASFYYLALLVYGVLCTFSPEGRKWHTLRGLLYDNIVVTGLNALLYTYLAAGGDTRVTFLIYSFSCIYLAQSMLRILTLRAYLATFRNVTQNERYIQAREDQLYTLSVLIFITLLTGFVIVVVPPGAFRYTLFVLDFGPFLLAIVLLIYESMRFNKERDETSGVYVSILVYGTLVFWFGYPIVMILGPDFTHILSIVGRDVGYISLDVITKHLFMAVSIICTYNIVWQSQTRGMRKL